MFNHTFVIDFDNTICMDKAVPNMPVIEAINRHYLDGSRIVIFTARGWARPTIESHLMARAEIEKFCKAYGVKYHEIILGKPEATFYVDDRALTPTEFVNL